MAIIIEVADIYYFIIIKVLYVGVVKHEKHINYWPKVADFANLPSTVNRMTNIGNGLMLHFILIVIIAALLAALWENIEMGTYGGDL